MNFLRHLIINKKLDKIEREGFISEEQLGLLKGADMIWMLDQAEKRVTLELGAADTIVSRTTTLVSVSITMATALVGFVFTSKLADPRSITATVGALYLLGVSIYASQNLAGFEYCMTGSSPKALSPLIDKAQTIELTKLLLRNEIEESEVRIKQNSLMNKRRWRFFENAFLFLIWTPAILTLAFIVSHVTF